MGRRLLHSALFQVVFARQNTKQAQFAKPRYPFVSGPAGTSPRATAAAVSAMNGAVIIE